MAARRPLTQRTLAPLAALFLALVATAAPAGAADAKLDVPFEKYTLPNGLEVVLHRDTTAPLVAVDIWYHVGSGDEMPGKSGFAHLFEHMMFQGTANTGEDRHFPVLQEAGASEVNGFTNNNRTDYYEVLPSNQLETALWLESERMAHLPEAITEKSLANQRDVVRNERRQNFENVPYGRDRFAVAAALYPEGHPYRHLGIGLHEDVEGGSLADVKGFFRTWYVPANATLVIAGDFDPAAARALVEKWFGSFPKSTKPAHRVVETPTISGVRRVEVHDSFAKLRRVHYAWVSPPLFAPGDAELDLLAAILGRRGTGRLYRRLVLEKPLAQNVTVYQDSQQRSSEFHVIVDLRPGTEVAEVERIVDEEIAAARAKAPEPRELARAVIAYENTFVRNLEPLLARAELLQSYNHFLGDPGRVDWDLDRYRRATAADVQAAAARSLGPEARVEVVTQPVPKPQDDPPVDFAPALPPAKASAMPQELTFPNEPFRAKQPAAGAPPELQTPPVVRFTAANGLDVVLLERHQIPVVRLEAEFPGGSASDPDGKEGLAELCMAVQGDGTQALEKEAFEGALADLGATVDAGAGIDRQSVVADTLTRNLDATLGLWADVLQRPGLRGGDLERDRARRLAALQQERSAPSPLGRRLLATVFYGEHHPIGRMATEASLKAVTLDDCKGLGAGLRPGGARLYVVGDVTRAALEQALARHLGGWTGTVPAVAALPAPVPRAGRIFFADVPGAAQSVIFMGEPGPLRTAADHAATRLAIDVLGGDFSSRVNMNLREDKGYAYGANAYIRYFKTLSVLRATAAVRTDATKDSVRELFGEMKRLAAGGITPDELRRNLNGEVLALPARFATGADELAAVRELVDFDLPLDYWTGFTAALRSVTPATADAAARAHVHPEDLRILVVGDGARVLAGLEELLASGALPAGPLVRLDGDGREVEPAKP